MLDFKKDNKNLYQPGTVPTIIEVPEMLFITVDGQGDPNTSVEYANAIEILYGFSYTIKMDNKAVLQYSVAPLEGFWSYGGDVSDSVAGRGAAGTDKDKYIWTAMIRQPDFVTAEVFEAARLKLVKKKPQLDLAKARLQPITEGLCVQVMHVGPYDDEPATIAAMQQFALDKGYAFDLEGGRRHHEIYISDPRRTAPEKLKTVIRYPIRVV